MKVFIFETDETLRYGSGLAVVSGRTMTEAFGVLMKHLDSTANGYYKCNFKEENGRSIPKVMDCNVSPSVLALNIYEE